MRHAVDVRYCAPKVGPIRLKALPKEPSIADEERALDLAKKHFKDQERNEYEALEEAIPDLIRLEHHDRRAWSQQKRAIGEFMNIKLMRKLQNASTNAT
jgi:hypothetical protein